MSGLQSPMFVSPLAPTYVEQVHTPGALALDGYNVAQFNSLKAMIKAGTGPASCFSEQTRTQAIIGLRLMATTCPGSQVDTLTTDPTAQDVMTLVDMANDN